MPPVPPYQPPQGPLGFDPYNPPINPLGPAKRAGILMWVLAGLALLCGVGLIAIVATVDLNPIIERSEQVYGPEMAAQMKSAGMNADQMRLSGFFWSGVGLLTAILMGVFGTFVMRGSMWAIVASIVLTSLLTLMNLCSSAGAALFLLKAGPAGLVGGCFALVPLIVCVVLLYLLMRAAKAAQSWKQMQLQMQAQYWQSIQQSAGPGQGYGYAPAPVPQTPAPQQSLGPLPPPPQNPPPPTV